MSSHTRLVLMLHEKPTETKTLLQSPLWHLKKVIYWESCRETKRTLTTVYIFSHRFQWFLVFQVRDNATLVLSRVLHTQSFHQHQDSHEESMCTHHTHPLTLRQRWDVTQVLMLKYSFQILVLALFISLSDGCSFCFFGAIYLLVFKSAKD